MVKMTIFSHFYVKIDKIDKIDEIDKMTILMISMISGSGEGSSEN